MPCHDGCNSDAAQATQLANDWQLCEAMVIIEKHGMLSECSQDLISWWKQHGTLEDARVKREAATKLDDRERLALGIDREGNPTKKKKLGKPRSL
jgi:hypothetical protein